MEATDASTAVDLQPAEPQAVTVPDSPTAAEEVSEERQDAFDVWQNTFLATGDYDPDGAVALWMKDGLTSEQLDELREKHGEIFFVVFPDIDQQYHPDVKVYICRRMLHKEWKDMQRRNVPTENQADQMVMRCVISPQIHAKEIGTMPSGIPYVLWKRIQEASGWTDSAIISKN